jgi:hypothetical protein
MFSARTMKVGYVLGLSTSVSLLLWPSLSEGQFGSSTPGLNGVRHRMGMGGGGMMGMGGGMMGMSGTSSLDPTSMLMLLNMGAIPVNGMGGGMMGMSGMMMGGMGMGGFAGKSFGGFNGGKGF